MDQLADSFRNAMARLAGGISVVTTWVDGRPWGMTVSACCSVSVTPPLLLVSLATGTASAQEIMKTGWFGVSFIAQDQKDVAEAAAVPGRPKFIERFTRVSNSQTPVVEGALAFLDCKVYCTLGVGDHTIFIGEAKMVELGEAKDPLIYYERQYRRIS